MKPVIFYKFKLLWKKFSRSKEFQVEKYSNEEKYSDGAIDTLIYIHVGKCGGGAVGKAIKESPVIREKFRAVKKVHVKKPFYQKNARYLIVLRNPIERAISAFNWQYRRVVETKKEEFTRPGEFEILKKYKNINNSAENLYVNDVLNISAVKEWQMVHHLREDIDFYLTDLLSHVRPDQIFAVLIQESLEEDVSRLLSVESLETQHENRSGRDDSQLELSTIARDNLRKFLEAEYAVIKKVNSLYPLDEKNLEVLLR